MAVLLEHFRADVFGTAESKQIGPHKLTFAQFLTGSDVGSFGLPDYRAISFGSSISDLLFTSHSGVL